MSIQTEINRITANVSAAYAAVAEKGGTLPEEQNSNNLAEAINGIPAGGGGDEDAYRNTRPADWLPMPVPQDNEMYLLFHIPDGVSSLLAFTVICTGSYTVATGTVENGAFVQSGTVSIASGQKYEAELFADDFGDLTSTGMKQCMVKITGTDILTWEPSDHSKRTIPTFFCRWNIVEIACRLPQGDSVRCGGGTKIRDKYRNLDKLKYFSWYGSNLAYDMASMFYGCNSLTAVLNLDAANVTSMSGMFYGCSSLVWLSLLNTTNVTDMSSMFYGCCSLVEAPQLNTANVTDMYGMFQNCTSLAAVLQLDTTSATDMDYIVSECYSLGRILLKQSVTGWAGCAISLSNCSFGHEALVDLFNSLPTITSSKTLTITGNPGVSELTDAEKAIATGKNWTLPL